MERSRPLHLLQHPPDGKPGTLPGSGSSGLLILVQAAGGGDALPWDGAPTDDTPNRRWVRWAARMLGASLDRRLALGQPPEGSRLLAARAVWLVSPGFRSRLASAWQRLINDVCTGELARSGAVRIRGAQIRILESEARAVIDGLIARGPVPARGVAMASALITDGAGPLYHGKGSSALSTALRATARYLDSGAPLLGATPNP
jgi:hypothetical protein